LWFTNGHAFGTMSDLDTSLAHAEAAGLQYVCDEGPGIRRRKRGAGFSYELPDGTVISDKTERERINAIAIPPAWTDVWISPAPDGHILATGRDARGRKQYRYHPEWSRVRSEDKFGSLPAFAELLPDLRGQVDGDLRRRGLPREKVLALVVRLLDETLIRVGNESYAIENESYGLTTMLPDHVEVDGSTLVFDFVAKGGLSRNVWLENKRLARIVADVSELGGQDLFAYISDGEVLDVTSTDVNAYLREHAGEGITAKHFRTWGGTVSAAGALVITREPESERHANLAVLAAFDVAAEVLGNTRTVCRQSYVHPAIPEAFADGSLAKTWKRARSTTHLDRIERTVQLVLDR
jgi:DNA topoisomerase-1